MNLTPREKDKLLISVAAMVARRRLERGVKLNYPEAIALMRLAAESGLPCDPARAGLQLQLGLLLLREGIADEAALETLRAEVKKEVDQSADRALAAGYPVKDFATLFGNDKDFIVTRVAYKLNLRGPAMTVLSACSTSLVAVGQGIEALRSGDADMVLAGGVPVQVAGALVGAVGVSGAPGGALDEACARAGVEAVQAELEFEE